MRRAVILLGIAAGCESPPAPAPAPTTWVVPPLPAAWTGVPGGSIGRGQAPQLVAFGGIAGSVAPMVSPVVWQVPGDGPARAAISGRVGDGLAVDVVEIDTGRHLWRDTAICKVPIVGVSRDAIVCSDGQRIVALSLDGTQRWTKDATFASMTGEQIVVAQGAEAIVLAAATGAELSRVKVSGDVTADAVIASCGPAELFATGQGTFVRIADKRVAWTAELPFIRDVEACDGTQIVAWLESGVVVTLARDTGRELSRRLGPPRAISQRGALRLERAGELAAVLVDDKGTRAYLPFAYRTAALGDTSLVASTWIGSSGHQVRRIVYPPRETRTLHVSDAPPRYIAVPAELRDLPPVTPAVQAPISTTIDRVTAFTALDETTLYALTVAMAEDSPIGVAGFDLRTKTWWQRDDACGTGRALGFAMANERLFCAMQTEKTSVVRAVSRTATLWEWRGANVDSVLAAGNLAIVIDADRLHVLDAKDGRSLGTLTSDSGAFMPAAVVDLAGAEIVVTAERNRVVGRFARAEMTPAWSLDVHGSVLSIEAAGDAVLVVLADGDAYRIDARTGVPTSLAAIGASWRVSGDALLASGEGGPIPVAGWPPAPAAAPTKKAKAPKKGKAAPVADDDIPRPPRQMTPIPPPPDLPPSLQQTVFSGTGALRSRNDYALGVATPADERGPGAPLLLGVGDTVLVLDPDGTPLRRVQLPGETEPDAIFSTVVDGQPVIGALLANPLRVVLF